MTTKQDVSMLLAGRTGMYRIFQGIFGNEPNSATLHSFANQPTQDILFLFESDNDTGYTGTLKDFLILLDAVLKDEDQTLNKISSNFTRLFVGPGVVEVDPWESVYVTNEHILFQPSTLEVRKAYVAQGLIPSKYPHVADDHIALELDFMAELAARLADAFVADDIAAVDEALSASEAFLSQHLLRFASGFNVALAKAKHNYFYKEAGALLNEFLKVDIGALEEIKSYLES
jgi:TorA maturation chaperone TorD